MKFKLFWFLGPWTTPSVTRVKTDILIGRDRALLGAQDRARTNKQ